MVVGQDQLIQFREDLSQITRQSRKVGINTQLPQLTTKLSFLAHLQYPPERFAPGAWCFYVKIQPKTSTNGKNKAMVCQKERRCHIYLTSQRNVPFWGCIHLRNHQLGTTSNRPKKVRFPGSILEKKKGLVDVGPLVGHPISVNLPTENIIEAGPSSRLIYVTSPYFFPGRNVSSNGSYSNQL